MERDAKFYNRFGEEIILFPLAKIIFDYPEREQMLYDALCSFSSDGAELSATRLQRKYTVRYGIADHVMQMLLISGAAKSLISPRRTEMVMDAGEACRLAAYLSECKDDVPSEEERALLGATAWRIARHYGKYPEPYTSDDSDLFCISEGYFHFYKGNSEIVDFPEGTLYINRYSFKNNVAVKRITLPEGVYGIDSDAFMGCSELRTVSLPDTLKKIGSRAFGRCSSLKEIVIPNSVERLYPDAFEDCSSLERVKLSENMDRVSYRAFAGCRSLKEIRIPELVCAVEEKAFEGCDELRLAYVPEHTVIDDDAFPPHTEIIRTKGNE